MRNKRFLIIVLVIVVLLLIPLIAMQFTNEVHWKISDFIVAGFLLLSFGLMIEIALMKIKRIRYRIAICLAFLIILLLVWAELAVGIFGSLFSGN